MVLVDTSVWIFALRKDPLGPAKERVASLLEEGLVATVGMIKLELLGGTKSEEEFHRLKTRLNGLYEIKIDSDLWERAAQLAFQMRRKGITLPYTDILIASCAIKAQALLLHADLHFDTIGEHTELRTESFVSLVQERIEELEEGRLAQS